MEFALPPVGEGLYEVELVRWLVKPGDAVQRGQPLMEVLSDKATMEVPSPFAGTITSLTAEPGTKVTIGQTVLHFTPETKTVRTTETVVQQSENAVQHAEIPKPIAGNHTAVSIAAAPSVRLLARRFGIDLTLVRGTGPGGRILFDDIAPHIQPTTPPKPAPVSSHVSHGLDLGKAGTSVKLTGIRRTIAEKMQASKQSIPHYSYIDECDVTDLVRVRGQLKEPFSSAGLKLTYLPFIIKAVTRALKHVPIVNSTFDDKSEEITMHDRYHIGVAVATSSGLMVPIIKDADRKGIPEIAAEIERLSLAARSGRVRADDLRGGTFTVTSIGSIGGLISTPIINRPEVGIVGVGKLVKRPVYDASGNLRPAELIYLSFSFDHRIVDGAIGAAFGNAVIRHLEHPTTLLLPDDLRSPG